MHKLDQILYTAHVETAGGREGASASSDGRLQATLSTPKALGGNDGPGTNPEQLFAAGYSACFIGAMKFVAGKEGVKLPAGLKIAASVDIGPIPQGFAIAAKLTISLPGMAAEAARDLVQKAHQVCPYSNATRGNIEVTLDVVT